MCTSTENYTYGISFAKYLNRWQHIFYSKSDVGKNDWPYAHIWLPEGWKMLCTLIFSKVLVARALCKSFFSKKMDIMRLQDYNPSLCTLDWRWRWDPNAQAWRSPFSSGSSFMSWSASLLLACCRKRCHIAPPFQIISYSKNLGESNHFKILPKL